MKDGTPFGLRGLWEVSPWGQARSELAAACVTVKNLSSTQK